MADVVAPEELFFDEFLAEHLLHPHMHPGSRIIFNEHLPADHGDCVGRMGICYWGSLLWMGDTVYRIGAYEREVNSWWARWPD